MSMITRSNVEAVMEPDVIREIMEGVVTQSKALSMFRRLPNMSSNKTKMRVLDALPMAYWIDAETNNGRKQLRGNQANSVATESETKTFTIA